MKIAELKRLPKGHQPRRNGGGAHADKRTKRQRNRQQQKLAVRKYDTN